MDRPCLLVQANTDEIARLASAKGISGSPAELCANEAVKKLALDSLVKTAASSLSSLEKIVAVELLPGTDALNAPLSPTSPWSPENEGLTPSNKLNRRPIMEALSPLIASLKK